MVDSRRKSKTPRNFNATLKNRGACILKKARELSVLCGIKVCALILDPAGKVHTWPENHVEVIDLLKQFKKAEKKQLYGVNAIADKDQTDERKTMDKTKELDFSCFDDKLINGLSRDSVIEIKNMLSSKIEAAKKRVEFLKMKEMTNFNPTPNFEPNLFNANPNFDPNFYFPQMQSTLPSIIGVPDSYFSHEQFGAIGLGNNWDSNFEPEIVLDFPPPLLSHSGVDNGCPSGIRVPANCYYGYESSCYSGSTCTESASPFEDQVVGHLHYSPLVEDVFNGASMAAIPLQPVQPLDYCFGQ